MENEEIIIDAVINEQEVPVSVETEESQDEEAIETAETTETE